MNNKTLEITVVSQQQTISSQQISILNNSERIEKLEQRLEQKNNEVNSLNTQFNELKRRIELLGISANALLSDDMFMAIALKELVPLTFHKQLSKIKVPSLEEVIQELPTYSAASFADKNKAEERHAYLAIQIMALVNQPDNE
ncbi:hypothetical protein [Vibrio anguillarum]|uniref:hypothetical protein n=1 Tax=Vibrio anguillarum TaxID=55601 RepID=UPI000BB4B620|nr:hypothetical protein [Vibrio anguillarum]ATC60209.1 hypothetical protein CMV05_22730 [Vibrio anguillarum]